MPTIADIPEHLKTSDDFKPFANWMKQQPVDFWVKQELAYLWSQFHKHTYTSVQWLTLFPRGSSAQPS